MEEFKGTKGDWRYSKEYALITTSKPGLVEGSKKICDLNENVSFGDNKGEMEANANLIAAAPDLLDSMKMLVFLHQCEQEGVEYGRPTPQQWIDAVEQGGKAIHKALGNGKET